MPIRSPPLCCVRSWIRDIPRQPFGTIHRVICQLVRTAILLARHPDVRDGTESTRGLVREPGERFQVGVLDLPATRHLLDHEFGIHPYFGRRAGRDERSRLQPGDQPAILGHVVGRVADSLRDLGKHLAGFGIHYDGPVSGVAWIAARTAVRLYEQPSDPMTRRQLLPRPSHSPDSGVRTRMRRHSSQRITSSGSAARMWFRYTVCRVAANYRSLVLAGQSRPLGAARRQAALRGFPALHDVEHDLLEISLPALQRLDLGLQVLQIPRRRYLASVQALAVPVGPRADLVNVRLGLGLLSRQVAHVGLSCDDPVPHGCLSRLEPLHLGVFGKRTAAIVEPVELGIEVGQFEQAQLLLGRCFHGSQR